VESVREAVVEVRGAVAEKLKSSRWTSNGVSEGPTVRLTIPPARVLERIV
jgi:hypothetical protein